MRYLGLTAIAVMLAACSPDAIGGNEAAAEASAAANVEAAVADNSAPVAPGLPVSDVPKAGGVAGTLPPAFLGRWGMNANDCDLSRSDTKGLVTIFADKLSFYESTGKVATLNVESQAKVVADLDFTGEGQTWKTRTTLEIERAGMVLVRTEESPAASYRYERC